jgi:hypothetical protein
MEPLGTFKQYFEEKNKFSFRRPKRTYKFRPGKRQPQKELTDVLPPSSRWHGP